MGEKDAGPGGSPKTVERRGVPEEVYLGRMLPGLRTGEICAVGSCEICAVGTGVLVAELEFRVVDPEPVPGGGTLLVNERRRCHPSIIPFHPGRGMRGTLDSAGNRSQSVSHQGWVPPGREHRRGHRSRQKPFRAL